MPAAVSVRGCSKWYGTILGVSDIDWQVEGGIVGLLGPNGAGKSTLLKMVAGLLAPSRGQVRVFGESPLQPAARRRIGYCPAHDGVWDELSALELVGYLAELSGLQRADARAAAARVLDQVGLTAVAHRRVGGFSKGMRQRTKLAQALVGDPELLLLDEPLTGVDPVARADLIGLIRSLASAGKTVIVSSHVLYEIEALTRTIMVIYRGQVLASGDIYAIRGLIDKHPHRIRVECDRPRMLGAALAAHEHVLHLSFARNALIIHTADPDRCYDAIGEMAASGELAVARLDSPDNNLSAVFSYLTAGHS